MNRELVISTCCKGCTQEEIEVFLHLVERTGLDPLARQIYIVRRWDKALQRYTAVVQTGIDGYRLIADRTGRYAPGRATEFTYDADGKIVSSTAYVRKMTTDGTWHEVAATAYWDEYVGRGNDGAINHMWATKPHIMLGKCAEALALRRAFPAELSGLYTAEEMDQAGPPVQIPSPAESDLEPPKRKAAEEQPEPPKRKAEPEPELAPPRRKSAEDQPEQPKRKAAAPELISDAQRRRLYALAKESGRPNEEISSYLRETYGIEDSRQIRREDYDEICAWIMSASAPPQNDDGTPF